jgi:RNA ligase (TIGR02306 family)
LSFPTYIIPKTDEERIQNCLGVLNECNNVDIYATIKLDGQSGTYYYHNFHYGVCSRERELGEKECTWRYISKRYGLRSKLKELSNKYGVALAIQGEVCGPGIQENKMGLDDVDFYVFNVWNITHRTYTTWNCVQTISEELGLKTVPLIKLPVTDFTNTDTSLNVLKNYVNTLKYGNGTPAEGMVIRAKDMRYSKTLRGVLSFKIISETFLLEYGE